MPKWGLTADMRRTRPWGLAEDLLQPGKVVTDPVHGDIHLTQLEVEIVDSPAFQRLRKVRQLGTTHLVYPGATHTRFSHSLGAVKVAQDLLDIVVEHRSARDHQFDLFAQWEAELSDRDETGHQNLSVLGAEELSLRIARVTVLARLGALLHDFCHVPFGHSIEDDLKILAAHDENSARFDRLWATMSDRVKSAISADPQLESSLRRLVLSKTKTKNDTLLRGEYAFVEDLVGNTICADLLDYLRRDHMYTGLPLALGRRYESGFYVMPKGDPEFQHHMVLRVSRGGHERRDAISEILKHLRYRYELSERALVHHAKLAADAMIGKALEMWRDTLWVENALPMLYGEDLPDKTAVFREVDQLKADLNALGTKKVGRLDNKVRTVLDNMLTEHGDEGLIEYLRTLPEAPHKDAPHRDVSRRAAVAHLAKAVEERHLYKRIAFAQHVRIDRRDFWQRHGQAEARKAAEERAAAFAGLGPAWHVLLWIPSPEMRLKVAGVLVDDGEEVRRFADREKEGERRGTEIYSAHENLWGVSVFLHPDCEVGDERKRQQVKKMLLASLSADLDMKLSRDLADELGGPPHEWPERLVIGMLADDLNGNAPEPERNLGDEAVVQEVLAMRRLRAARGATDRPPAAKLKEEFRVLWNEVSQRPAEPGGDPA